MYSHDDGGLNLQPSSIDKTRFKIGIGRAHRVFASIFLTFSICADGRELWRFLPCFGKEVRGIERHIVTDGSFDSRLPLQAERLLAMDSGLNEAQRRNVRWHPVSFPHREFMALMPARRVFGWYGCEFDVPRELSGMDVLADLGIIDDSDETFVNGTQIGGMGRIPEGSAWQSDRLYRISSELLKRERNYLAVHVWSLWGLGGIVGPPVLKAALAPAGAEWHLAFVKDTVTLASDLNQATPVKDALASIANDGKPLDWRKASIPWKGFAAWRDDEHYAVFKFTFELKNEDGSPKRFPRPMVMDAGPVFDVAAFYLNGWRVGLVGRFPHEEEPAFTEAAQWARFAVPPDAWSADGRNELVAVVYRERGVGGLPGMPAGSAAGEVAWDSPCLAGACGGAAHGAAGRET